MKKGWKKLPFLEVFEDVSGGNTKTPQREYLEEGLIPVVDQGKILIGGYTDESARVCKTKSPVIIFGDHTRIIKYIDFPFAMGADGVKVLKPKIETNAKYLFYYLSALQLPDAGYDRHFKYLKRTEIVLPDSEDEQKRIAAVLDKADALREKRRAAITKLDELLQSVFLDMFGDPVSNPKGWSKEALESVCQKTGQYGSGAASKPFEAGQPRYIRITDIVDNGNLKDEIVSPNCYESEWKNYVLGKGDVLFARSGATVGKTYQYKTQDGFAIFAGYLIRFKPNDKKINSDYLFHYTKTQAYKKWVESQQRAVAQPNINAKQYGTELVLPVPPIKLQDEFSVFISKVERIKNSLIQAYKSNEILFQSLQQRAFAGELFGAADKPEPSAVAGG